jgi:hypothetical protein
MGVPKLLKLGLSWFWGPITLCVNLRLKLGLKQSISPHRELFNSMSHATCTQGNQVDSWFLVIESWIVNLTPGPSFGQSLCFKCPNGSYKPTLDIYVPRDFQWYKKFPNPMAFDPYNHSMKIWESIRSPTFQNGSSLGSGSAHFLTLSSQPPGSMKCDSQLHFWFAPLQALTLVTIPRLKLWQVVRLNHYFIDNLKIKINKSITNIRKFVIIP